MHIRVVVRAEVFQLGIWIYFFTFVFQSAAVPGRWNTNSQPAQSPTVIRHAICKFREPENIFILLPYFVEKYLIFWSLKLKLYFWNFFYISVVLYFDKLLLLQVRFTAWQFVKRIAAWIWSYIFETVFYFAFVLRLDNLLLYWVQFLAWQSVKFIAAWVGNYIFKQYFISHSFCGWTIYFYIKFSFWLDNLQTSLRLELENIFLK